MTPRMLLRESFTAARHSPIPSALVALVVAAMCFVALVTVGRQAAVEVTIAEELAGPAARTLTISDATGNGLSAAPIEVLTGLEGVSAVLGRSLPIDVVNGALGDGGTKVALIEVQGDLSKAIRITTGRVPGPDEVLIPNALLETLRFTEPTGYVEASDGRQWSIVGSFEPLTPFNNLNAAAIAVAKAGSDIPVQQITVVAAEPQYAAAMRDASLAIVDPKPDEVEILNPTAAGAKVQAVSSELAGYGRTLLLLILGVGSFFVATVVLADVLIRRRDLGRRRTLGITRFSLVALVALRTSAPAIIGAMIGTGAAQAIVSSQEGLVPWDFTVAIPIIAVVTAILMSLAPATYAAYRDPVTIMRTP